MSSTALFRRLLTYSLRYWGIFAIAIIAMMVTAAAETAFPALMKPLIDRGFSPSENFQVWWAPVGIIAIFLTRGAASFVANYGMYLLSQNVLRDIRSQLFKKLISCPTTFYDSNSSGHLISRLISDAQMVLSAATNVATVIVRDSLVLIGLMLWLLWLNWQLTLIVLLVLPPLVLLTQRFSRRMRRVGKTYLTTIGEMTSTVEEAIAGNRVIKTFGSQGYEIERFERVNAEHRSQGMRLAVASALQSPMTQLIASFGVATVITIALFQARIGGATIGDFVSFITAMIMMLNPLRHLAETNSQLQRGLAAAEGLFALLDEKSETNNGTHEIKHVDGEIIFNQVNFRYKSRESPALTNFSLIFPKGKTYAIVGPSGGGKSSLLALIPRLYEIESGEIQIDGIDIRELTLESLRAQIALVSQDVILFNDTIHANICYGQSHYSEDRIRESVIASDLSTFLASLPDGIYTQVGDRGVRVSGGQRQRIAIARAILKNAPILLLDEATSALDNQSEIAVQRSIDQLRKNRTTIVVAHRLSTIVNADMIIVVDEGRIVQNGSHEELIRVEGLYQNLYSKLKESVKLNGE
jgi:subfamily B ATP-binding cassette protein MsbA